MISKGLENWFPQALVYATSWCVSLWNCLWKGFWKGKYFSLSYGVTVQVGNTVTFLFRYIHLLHCLHEKCVFGIVHCAWPPWSAEQWAYKTDSRQEDSLPAFNKCPSQTLPYRAVPQMLGLACMLASMQEKLRLQQLRGWMWVQTHTPNTDTPFFPVPYFFFSYMLKMPYSVYV